MIPYADLRKQPRLDLAASIPLDAPLTVYVEPTNVCNLSCDFCPQSLEDYKERAGYHEHMPLEMFENLMWQIDRMHIKSLKLYFFGEPLMHPDIGEMCDWAGRTSAEHIELTTNLIPLTQEKATSIIDSGIHYVRVSWYGDNPRVRKNLKMLMDTRKYLESAYPHIVVKYHDESHRYALANNPPACDEIVGERLHTVGSDFVHLKSYEENKKACPYPFYTLVVKSNGDVVPCCVAWDKSLVVGNVKESSLKELWNSKKMHEIRMTHLWGCRGSLSACKNCDTIFNCPDNVDSVTPEEYEQRCDS